MADKKLRICFVSQGESCHLKRRLSYLVARGHEVFLITDKTSGVAGIRELEKTPAHTTLPKIGIILRFIVFWNYLRMIKPDILHINWIKSYNALAALSNFHPLILTAWGGDILPERGALDDAVSRFIVPRAIRQADLLTAVSLEIKEELDKYKSPGTPSLLMRFGVDLSVFRKRGIKEEIKQKLGIDPRDRVIFCPRTAAPIYNLDTVVEAIPLVLKKTTGVKFILKSHEADNRLGYLTGLEKLIKQLGVEDQVIFNAELSDEQMAEVYNAADVVVSVPSSDGSPVSVLEAMACEVPLIVTDLPSLREFMCHEKNGLFVPVREAEALAEAIVKLLTNTDLGKRFTMANLEFVRENADFDKEMKQLEEWYYELAK